LGLADLHAASVRQFVGILKALQPDAYKYADAPMRDIVADRCE
jgi:hypothetical protein